MKKKILGLFLLLALYMCMGMTAFAAQDASFATGASARLVDKATVNYSATLPSVPATDDGVVYLFELGCYQYSIPDGAQAIASAPVSQNPSFNVALNHNQANTRLYSKFALGVRNGGKIEMIANPQYITNPEVLAYVNRPYTTKVLNLQGVDFYNIFMGEPSGYPPTARTLQLMNTGNNQAITNPYSRAGIGDSHPTDAKRYYMLNCAEPNGVALVAQQAAYYAEKSNAVNFIVGDEVNIRSWNYMTFISWEEYLRQYEQTVRVVYNAVKSVNKDARVYVCLDQTWDRDRKQDFYAAMDGKDFLLQLNADMRREGNIGWGVAQHPWTVPLTNAAFWAADGYSKAQVAQNKMLSFQNLGNFASFMMSPEMLAPDGSVRPVIASEMGVNSAQGEAAQAATLYASYYAIASNPVVTEAYYLNMPCEAGLDTSLTPTAQAVWDSLAKGDLGAYDGYAKSVIGISDWGQVLH